MRGLGAIWMVGALALGAAACSQASGPGAATKAPTYACITTIDAKTATCIQFSNIPGGAAGVARLKRGCLVVPGQSFGAVCPADGLVGCCAMPNLPDEGNPKNCFYKGGPLMGTPAQCAKDGGVWSAAP